MTIINLDGIEIDTEMGHDYHKDNIPSTVFCDTHDPKQWFAEYITHENGETQRRFYQLHYNEEGDMLKKITSYDSIPHTEHRVRKLKNSDSDCYWSKNAKSKNEDDYEWVMETDYDSPISENHLVWWTRDRNWLGRYK